MSKPIEGQVSLSEVLKVREEEGNVQFVDISLNKDIVLIYGGQIIGFIEVNEPYPITVQEGGPAYLHYSFCGRGVTEQRDSERHYSRLVSSFAGGTPVRNTVYDGGI